MTPISKRKRAANDRRVARDIERYGCHVISVFDPDGRLPSFSYSIGIQDSSGAPDVIVFGLRPEPARRARYVRYAYGCARYYGEREYSMVQLVWPSTKGVWPWNKSASKWLVRNQPMLGRKRPDRA